MVIKHLVESPWKGTPESIAAPVANLLIDFVRVIHLLNGLIRPRRTREYVGLSWLDSARGSGDVAHNILKYSAALNSLLCAFDFCANGPVN